MIRKDTDKLISFKFFSLSDFYNTVSEKIEKTQLSKDWQWGNIKGYNKDFVGAPYSEIIQMKYSWPEGVKKLKELSDMEKIITKKWSKQWNEEDGDDMCMERYFNSMPFLQKRVKVLGERSRNNVIQKVIVNTWENCGVDSKKMLWKTYTVVKLVDELESQGVRCEVVIMLNGNSVDYESRKVQIEIPIKEANESINTSLLCTVFSPWFFRYWVFQLLFGHIPNVRESLGCADKTPKDQTENCIVIDNGTALSKEAANNFLKGINS